MTKEAMKIELANELTAMLQANIDEADRYLDPGCTVLEGYPFIVIDADDMCLRPIKTRKGGKCEYSFTFNPLQAGGFTREDAKTLADYLNQISERTCTVLTRRDAVKKWKASQTDVMEAIKSKMNMA